MILLSDELRAQRLANGPARGADHFPVVKLFNQLGSGVWLAAELDADSDTLFGLADLGEPELGYFSLEELFSLRLPFGMGIERDILFTGDFQISVWAAAAREAGSIRAAERIPYSGDRALYALRLDANPEISAYGAARSGIHPEGAAVLACFSPRDCTLIG